MYTHPSDLPLWRRLEQLCLGPVLCEAGCHLQVLQLVGTPQYRWACNAFIHSFNASSTLVCNAFFNSGMQVSKDHSDADDGVMQHLGALINTKLTQSRPEPPATSWYDTHTGKTSLTLP